MKSTAFFVAALAGSASAMPRKMARDLFDAVAKRADTYVPSSELWGEWKTATGLSKDQKALKEILQGKGSGTYEYSYKAAEKDSDECAEDTCCIWTYVNEELYSLFREGDGCNSFARAAIRMGFHDSSSWNKHLTEYGADGSLLLHENELTDVLANSGGMVNEAPNMMAVYDKYKSYGVTMADLLQAGAKVGALACNGPRLKMYIGREDHADARPPDGLLPPAAGPNATADALVALFEDKTVTPSGLIALLGAHTVSRVNNGLGNTGPFPCQAEGGFPCPQDTTPGKWNTDYFGETQKDVPSTGVFRFESDTNLANDTATGGYFSLFETDKALWDKAYAKEYVRMSMFGVRNIKKIVDCSKAMPKGKMMPGGGHGDYTTSSTKSYSDYKPTKSYSDYKPTATYGHGGHGGHDGHDDGKPTYEPTYTTSTYTHTQMHTIYSCAPEVKDCPYDKDHPLTTVSYYVTTTVCEVTPTEYPTKSATKYPTHDAEHSYPTYSSVSSMYDGYKSSETIKAPEYTKPTIAPEYPAIGESAAAPVYPESSSAAAPVASNYPVTVSGAGRTTVAGVFAAAAGLVVAALA